MSGAAGCVTETVLLEVHPFASVTVTVYDPLVSDELVEKLTQLQKKHIDTELDKWERGEWDPKDHRASMDEVMRKIKKQYQFKDDDII